MHEVCTNVLSGVRIIVFMKLLARRSYTYTCLFGLYRLNLEQCYTQLSFYSQLTKRCFNLSWAGQQ